MLQDSAIWCYNALFPYLSHSAVVILRESSHPVPNGRKRGGRERPPPKWGGHVTPIAVLSYIPLSGPMRGRSRPHLSLREGSEPAPQEGR